MLRSELLVQIVRTSKQVGQNVHKACRTLAQNRTAAEASEASEQIGNDVEPAHLLRSEPTWSVLSYPWQRKVVFSDETHRK